MRINVHLYPSSLEFESRIFRITQTILDNRLADRVLIIGTSSPKLQQRETLSPNRQILRIPLHRFPFIGKRFRRLFRYLEWLFLCYLSVKKERPFMVNCHSIFDLPVGYLFKLFYPCFLVYDTHELETERNGLNGLLKIVCKIIEKMLVPFCDQIFTVSDSIGDWYKSRYPSKRVQTILNIPPDNICHTERPIVSLRSRFAIPDENLIFLYLGVLNSGRGLDLMIRVFSSGPAIRHLVLIGYGPLAEPIRRRVQACPNIHLLDAVPTDMIQAHAAAADVGLVLIENTCLSYYYCLPNKLFENYLAGTPCIMSDFPELSRFVKSYPCGWKTAVSEDALSRLVGGLSGAKIEAMRSAMNRTADPPHWEDEEKKLLTAYVELLVRASG